MMKQTIFFQKGFNSKLLYVRQPGYFSRDFPYFVCKINNSNYLNFFKRYLFFQLTFSKDI